MPKKSEKKEKPIQQRDAQSFFYVSTFAEMLVLSVLIILVLSYSSVFSADGIVFLKVFHKVDKQDVLPDKKQVITRIEEVKVHSGSYPYDLGQAGLKEHYGSTRLDYSTTGQDFDLCYAYFPYLAGSSSCYHSNTGQWD